MRLACRLAKLIVQTLSKYVIMTAFSLKQFSYERPSMSHYRFTAAFVAK
jgi:hypothetical protein